MDDLVLLELILLIFSLYFSESTLLLLFGIDITRGKTHSPCRIKVGNVISGCDIHKLVMKNNKKSGKKESHVTKDKKRNIVGERNVKRANRLSDPLSEFPSFKVYNKNGLNLELECKKVRDLDTGTVDAFFDLLKNNMEKLYRTSDWGWDDKKKLSQMTDPAAWYLIARDEEKTPVAFSHFRFDMDYGVDVLYLYELQLKESVRRKGLGKFMSEAIELIAFKNNMKKVVLTCFKHNPDAMDFYKSMNFTIDCTSPEETEDESYCYYILSKPNIHLEAIGS